MLLEVYKCVQLNRCSVVCGCVFQRGQFCKDLKIGVTPFPPIGLGRRTTTITGERGSGFRRLCVGMELGWDFYWF